MFVYVWICMCVYVTVCKCMCILFDLLWQLSFCWHFWLPNPRITIITFASAISTILWIFFYKICWEANDISLGTLSATQECRQFKNSKSCQWAKCVSFIWICQNKIYIFQLSSFLGKKGKRKKSPVQGKYFPSICTSVCTSICLSIYSSIHESTPPWKCKG